MSMVTRTKDLSSYINPDKGDITDEVQTVKMTHSLLRQKIYDVPEAMRNKVLQSALKIMDSDFAENKDKIMAARLILEADKRNLEFLKIITPKAHLHANIRDLPTKEIHEIIRNAQKMLPPEYQEILDV